MYVHLLTTFTGWTWEYIDEFMTLPRLRAMTAYQVKHQDGAGDG